MKNKLVIITGASSGIGKACAEKFAQEGANLVLAARSSDKLREVAENIATGTVNFVRDPKKSVGDAVSNTVAFFAGNTAASVVAVGETLAEGASTVADAVVKAATPVRAEPRKRRERLSQRRKEKIEQKVERFTPLNSITAPLAGFHEDL